MSLMPTKKRIGWLGLWAIFVLGLYKLIQAVVIYFQLESNAIEPVFAFERQIPFIPSFIFIYASVFLLPLGVFLLIKKEKRVLWVFKIFTLAFFVHVFFFLVLPVSYTLRPHLTWSSDFLSQLVKFYYVLDEPTNTFPSMHVSFAFLSFYVVKRFRRDWMWFFLMAAVAISLSTLFVKQHYVVDVLGAVLMVMIINHFTLRRSTLIVTEEVKGDSNQ